MKNVTVIDDSEETHKVFQESWANKGEEFRFQPITEPPFFSPEIEKDIVDFQPDLIILDILLSDSTDSGFRVLRKIRESEQLRKTRVAVISKYITGADDPYAVRAIGFGATVALPFFPFQDAADAIFRLINNAPQEDPHTLKEGACHV